MRKKWWEFLLTEDETKLFNIIARNPKFKWRNIETVLKLTGWSPLKFNTVIDRFVLKKIILIKRTKKGLFIGYWEHVDADAHLNDEKYEEYEEVDPNVI